MADYLIDKYNLEMLAIQNEEADALSEALNVYFAASIWATNRSARERFDAGVKLAAAMSQRDHEYHNGRPAPAEDPKTDATPGPPVTLKAYNYAAQPEMNGETA